MALRDVIDIRVQAGKGGDGGLSFLRLKYVPKGGPDGGHGGEGGSIYLEAVDDVGALERITRGRVYKAQNGKQGEGRNRAGSGGQDSIIQVPIGTIARDLDSGELLADLLEPGQRVCVAQGGQGGRGNTSFANSRRQTPRFAEFGSVGQQRSLRLELRLIADAGLVGYPNAGKSSLLAALSNAKPQIAAYPFTTLSPNLGVLEQGHDRLTLADIPGIIDGASQGKGLGLEFLRHIARTRLLVYVLDVAEAPVAAFEALQAELAAYEPSLLSRSALIALNKSDLVSDDELQQASDALSLAGLPIFPVSAQTKQGLEGLLENLFALLPSQNLRPLDPEPKPINNDPIRVVRDASGQGWQVHGRAIEAIVERFDPNNREAVAYLQHHFKTLGVYSLLKRAGAKNEDSVSISGAVFDYFDEQQSQNEPEADTADTWADDDLSGDDISDDDISGEAYAAANDVDDASDADDVNSTDATDDAGAGDDVNGTDNSVQDEPHSA